MSVGNGTLTGSWSSEGFEAKYEFSSINTTIVARGIYIYFEVMEREEDFHARMSGNAIRRILAFQDHEMESSRVGSRRLEMVESSSGWLCNDIRLPNSCYYSLVFSPFVACANIISDGTRYILVVNVGRIYWNACGLEI